MVGLSRPIDHDPPEAAGPTGGFIDSAAHDH
jgi:hypothetical protein